MISAEFPELESILLPDYQLYFNNIIPLGFHVALQSLKIRRNINLEKLALEEILETYQIDGIISDNRYGVYSSSVPSVIITHQLKLAPKTPFRSLANNQIKKYLNRFSEIWVPDLPNSVLTEELSATSEFSQKKYIGLLSRFKAPSVESRENFILAVISGTEPHRTIIENRLIKILGNTEYSITLVRGIPDVRGKKVFPENFTVHEHLKTQKLETLLSKCQVLLSRSGYSTIMDAIHTQTPVILIPTKGQSEQNYLAKRLHANFKLPLLSEKKLSSFHIAQSKTIDLNAQNLLSEVIGKWLNEL
ncbi:MAG: glycosyltransferase [Flavobacteriales bacterium]